MDPLLQAAVDLEAAGRRLREGLVAVPSELASALDLGIRVFDQRKLKGWLTKKAESYDLEQLVLTLNRTPA